MRNFGRATRRTLAALFVLLLAAPGPAASGEQHLQAVAGTPVAPDFRLENLDGEIVALSDLKGQVVIVNFWATWCPPCRAEMPSMQRTWQRLKGEGVAMLAVHVGGNTDKIWSFVGEYGIEFPVLIDPNSKVANAWPMQGLPTTFVVSPQGRIVYQAVGGREWDDPGLLETVLSVRN